jgi:RHS repeat-associated protein
MLQRAEGSTTTNFHWDGWDLIREEKDDGVDIEVTNYLVPHGEVLAFERDDEWFYLHNDGISSTQLVTDESGAQVGRMVYGAWGETLSSSESVPGVLDVRFVGGLGVRNDAATGLIWMRHRWYDPTLNRFISRDPIGLAGGSNLYKYSANNPSTYTDPSGLLNPAGDSYIMDNHFDGSKSLDGSGKFARNVTSLVGVAIVWPFLVAEAGPALLGAFLAAPATATTVGAATLETSFALGTGGDIGPTSPLSAVPAVARFGSAAKDSIAKGLMKSIRDKCTPASDEVLGVLDSTRSLFRHAGDDAFVWVTKSGRPQIWLGAEPLLVQALEESTHYDDIIKWGETVISFGLKNRFAYEALTKIRVAVKFGDHLNRWDKVYLALGGLSYK